MQTKEKTEKGKELNTDFFRLCPQLSGCILFAPPEARGIFYHNDLLCNDKRSVNGGCIAYCGRGHQQKRHVKTFKATIIHFSLRLLLFAVSTELQKGSQNNC